MTNVNRKEAGVGLLFSLAIIISMALACGPTQYNLLVSQPKDVNNPYVKMPVAPVQPDPVLTSLGSIVDTPPIINSYKQRASIGRSSTVGVMDFKAAGSLGSGTLVADTFSISFLNRHVNVVERQNIKKITEEQMMAAKGMTQLNDSEIAKRIGQLTRADYIVFGAVTQYHFENTSLPIPYIIPPDELDKYLQEIKSYKNAREKAQEQFIKNDENMFNHIREDLFTQLQRLDLASLNRLMISGVNWKNISAQSLQWNYPYFKSRRVFPVIGEKTKNLEYKQQKVEQEIEAWKNSFTDYLKKRDESISAEELKAFYESYAKYNESLRDRKEEIKEGEKELTKIYDDENIQRNKQFCKKTAEKLKEYFDLLMQHRRYQLKPIPEKQGQFELPKDKSRFVSVANIGITFKVIDVKTGEIVWIGQASKRDLNIQQGLTEMVEAVVTDIVGS